jgi:hypothetical protein
MPLPAKESVLGVFKVNDLVDPHQNAVNPQTQDRSFKKWIDNYGPKLGIEIEQIVVFPDSLPWKPQKKYPCFYGKENV